jgi:hypothetical protein
VCWSGQRILDGLLDLSDDDILLYAVLPLLLNNLDFRGFLGILVLVLELPNFFFFFVLIVIDDVDDLLHLLIGDVIQSL